jgi:hypothetical protein
VLANGLDIIYPPSNRGLARRIVESGQGALMTEFPLGVKPDGRNFPARNRIISGLSLGVLVVEAPERSGALITAEFALKQGREVFAVPGNIFSSRSMGTNWRWRSAMGHRFRGIYPAAYQTRRLSIQSSHTWEVWLLFVSRRLVTGFWSLGGNVSPAFSLR